MKKTILVVDDDTRLRDLLTKYLSNEGFKVFSTKDTLNAKKIIKDNQIDLIVLDVMMPDEDGISFTRHLRKNKNNIPILMLTAMEKIQNRIEGLESGADDYLQKPFEPRELLLRIENILRRTTNINSKKNQHKYRFGNFTFNLKNKKLKKYDKFVYLTEAETEIMQIFCKHINSTITREELSKMLGNIDKRSIDVQITRLRRKIEDNTKKPQHLQTKRGIGYILKGVKE